MLCVAANAPGGGNGTAGQPFARIGDAIAHAGEGATIQVAQGEYRENLRIEGRSDLVLAGGFASGDFTQRAADSPTTLVAAGEGSVIAILGSSGIRIDRFTVTGGTGHTNSEPRSADNFEGGGIFIDQGSTGIDVVSNDVRDNSALGQPSYDGRGGGIASYGSEIRILGNVIRENTAGLGGGVYHDGGTAIIDGNQIEDNDGVGNHGGGLNLGGLLQITRNWIRGNATGVDLDPNDSVVPDSSWGGGVVVLTGSRGETVASFAANVITENAAITFGSGVFVDEAARATLTGDLIFRNDCPADGGAGLAIDPGGNESDGFFPSSAVVRNATIADHECTATNFGGSAVFVKSHSSLTLLDSIVWNNGMWNDAPGDYFTEPGAELTVRYTLSSAAVDGDGNFSADPQFADPASGDYHVRSQAGRWDPTAQAWVVDTVTSPAIDAGDPASALHLEPMPNGGRVNLGAYGNTAEASKSYSP